MQDKTIIGILGIYKIIINVFRMFLGILLLYFNCDIKKAIMFVFHKEISEDPADLFAFIVNTHIKEATFLLGCILAFSLIIISVLEIFFVVIVMKRKRWGAVGFILVSMLWIFVEFFFVNKFLETSFWISLIIDVIIILFFIRLLFKSRDYFKK